MYWVYVWHLREFCLPDYSQWIIVNILLCNPHHRACLSNSKGQNTKKWRWWCLQKNMKCVLWAPLIKACVYLFGLYINSKHHQGAFISAVFIPNINSVSFLFSPFAQDHVILMLSDFGFRWSVWGAGPSYSFLTLYLLPQCYLNV